MIQCESALPQASYIGYIVEILFLSDLLKSKSKRFGASRFLKHSIENILLDSLEIQRYVDIRL